MFAGNTIETDVVQETGKAILCELNEKGKYSEKEIVSERTDDVKSNIEELKKSFGYHFLAD